MKLTLGSFFSCVANGDVYDGSWLHDKKEGPGRFYYKASGKVYDGEWVDDAPQCGTYSDITTVGGGSASHFGHDDANPQSRLHRFELPEVRLTLFRSKDSSRRTLRTLLTRVAGLLSLARARTA